MRNKKKSHISTIIEKAGKLPFFTLEDLASMETNKQYLKILLSRYVQAGKVARLKKGVYVAREYIHGMETSGAILSYPELLACTLYRPSYVSLEYMLYKHNMITEVPVNVTAVTVKKTATFSNDFGTFIYHAIRPDLFIGYETVREGSFTVLRATQAKALFDYLYFRKNSIADQSAADELRLNLGEFSIRDKKEFALYVKKEGSKKMMKISQYLFHRCRNYGRNDRRSQAVAR